MHVFAILKSINLNMEREIVHLDLYLTVIAYMYYQGCFTGNFHLFKLTFLEQVAWNTHPMEEFSEKRNFWKHLKR